MKEDYNMEHWEHRVVKRTDEEGEYLTVEGVLLDGDVVIIPTEDIFWDSKLLGEYQLNNEWEMIY